MGTERVNVDLAGYAEELLVLLLDEDVDLTLSLKPSTAVAGEAATKKRGHARRAPSDPQARSTPPEQASAS